MSSKSCIQICHSDESLIAEVNFWANSAGYDLDVQCVDDTRDFSGRNVVASIIELTGNGDFEVDVIESLAQRRAGEVIAITALDGKTIASIRRLFQEKSIEAVVIARTEFTTRQLADLIKIKQGDRALSLEVLTQSIRDGNVIVHYQPKVPFRPESREFGVEALCRIQHPALGTIFPDSFIPLAEAHDLIQDLTDAVTVQAFRDMAEWDRQGRCLRMALNVSPRLMSSTAWFELFEKRCQEFNIDPRRITLEVTESSSQGGKVLALEILSRLRLKGFLLSIDDFGTGFSSLETLYKLPFGELKIDKGFIFDFHKSAEARTLVESTVTLARKLGLKITAEGVETAETFQELRSLKCDDAQGYFISKPIAADQIVPFFSRWETEHVAAPTGPASQLRAVQGLLAEILSAPDDDEDATIVLGAPSDVIDSGRDIVARIPALLLGSDWLGALEHAHRALQAEPGKSELSTKLEALRNELEGMLLARVVVLRNGAHETLLQSGESFILGRESSTGAADIAIPCRWLSRGPKNLKLFYDGAAWKVCDLGSTNGHFHGGTRLVPNHPLILPNGETILEIGKVADQPAPAWLCFRVNAARAVEISYGSCDAGSVAEGRRWLAFSQEFGIGAADSIVAGAMDAEVVADISARDGGLWITPRPGRSLLLGGREFSRAVPLACGKVVSAGSMSWYVAESFGSAALADPLKATA